MTVDINELNTHFWSMYNFGGESGSIGLAVPYSKDFEKSVTAAACSTTHSFTQDQNKNQVKLNCKNWNFSNYLHYLINTHEVTIVVA